MPKIIENLRENLVAEAKRQVHEAGYAALTVRSVATACGVGVGTVYNYFDSKDALVAAFMLEDWQSCIAQVERTAWQTRQPEATLQSIYHQLRRFMDLHQPVFADSAAVASFSGSPSPYHSLLRRQLAQPLTGFCPDDFTAEFIAEAMLTWTVAGRSFEEIYAIIKKMI